MKDRGNAVYRGHASPVALSHILHTALTGVTLCNNHGSGFHKEKQISDPH